MRMPFAILTVISVQAIMFVSFSMIDLNQSGPEIKYHDDTIAVTTAMRRSYPIDIKTIGELEAANSISIGSPLRSDQAKIIYLIADGTYVKEGDILMKIDPTPFEKRIEELKGKVMEQEAQIEGLKQSLEWEITQVEHDNKASQYESETAVMELDKLIKGEGPLEIARLKQGMLKAESGYNELDSYKADLEALEQEGYLMPTEVEQTKKKILEEKQNYESAKLQYDTYVDHVFPMLIKKAETHIKRMCTKCDEIQKNGKYRIQKIETQLMQAHQQHVEIWRQYKEAEYELVLMEMKAPASGMVVLRDEFRSTERRKPRVGDVLIRNQAILDLPDLSKMVVKTKVREIDLFKIDIGKPVTIEIDAYPHMQLKGEVSFIGILAMTDQLRISEEKNFEVKVLVQDADPRLRPGMTTRLVIHAGNVEDAITVPVHSVFEVDKKHYCYVVKETGYLRQPVVLGMSNDHWVEVFDGLEEGDQICLSKPLDQMIIVFEEDE